MPKFNVTSPDGLTYEVDAPEGATQEQAIQYVQDGIANGSIKPKTAADDTNAFERVGYTAGTAILNTPAAVLDTVKSAGAWLGDQFGIGDGTYTPTARFELDEKYKPQGAVEEFAAEAIPYLIPYTGAAKAATTGAKLATRLGATEGGMIAGAAERVARNGYQGLFGSAANNSEDALGADFVAEAALNAGLGAGIEKAASGAGNLIKAGKEARRARMAQTGFDEYQANVNLDKVSKEVHNISSNHNDFELGIPKKGADKKDLVYTEGPRKGEVIREEPQTIGELQKTLRNTNDPRFAPKGSHDYLPSSFNSYLSNLTGGKYNLFSDDIPEALLNTTLNSTHTNVARSNALGKAKEQFDILDNSRFNSVLNNNEAILDNSNIISRALYKPSSDIGALTQEQQKRLGLSRMEQLVATIGSKSNNSLPFDVGTLSRYGSNKIINERKQGIRDIADSNIEGLANKKDAMILKKLENGELKSNTGRFFSDQAEAWGLAKSGKSVSELTDDQLENLLISSNQSKVHNKTGSRIPDNSSVVPETPVDVLRGVREIDELKEASPLSIGPVGSATLGLLSGGVTTAAQATAAILGRRLNASVGRDIRRVAGENITGDATRNAIGEGLEEGAKKVNTGTYGTVDLELDNDRKIEQLDDWATKNGISPEILSEAIRIKGADLGSLKGINSIKGLALDLDAQARANDSTLSVGEGYNPNHTLATRQISQAMAEAMYGLSDDEKEAIIDDYLDSVHLEEDEKLVGLKLQRAIQKAVKYALDKSS